MTEILTEQEIQKLLELAIELSRNLRDGNWGQGDNYIDTLSRFILQTKYMEVEKIQFLLNNTDGGWMMNDKGVVLLKKAVWEENVNLIEAMYKLGLDLNSAGPSLLTTALNHRPKLMKTLLQKGLDPNKLDFNIMPPEGIHPLGLALISYPNEKTLDPLILLTLFGADYNLISYPMLRDAEVEVLQGISSTCSMIKSIFEDINKDIDVHEFFLEIVKEVLKRNGVGEVEYANTELDRTALEELIADHIVQYIKHNQEIPPIPKLLERKVATSLFKDLENNGANQPILEYMERVIKLCPFIKKDWETYNEQSMQDMEMLAFSIWEFEKDFKEEFAKECAAEKFIKNYNLRIEKGELISTLSNPDFYKADFYEKKNETSHNSGDTKVTVTEKEVEEKLKSNQNEISSKLDETLKFCSYFMKVTHDIQENLVKAEPAIMLLQTIMNPIFKNSLQCIKTETQAEQLKTLKKDFDDDNKTFRGLLLNRLQEKSHEYPLSSKDSNNNKHVEQEMARRTTRSRSLSPHR